MNTAADVRPKKAEKILDFALTHGANVLITGRPGVGKTDMVKAAAERLGHDFIVSHPVVDQPIDYKGLPWASEGKAGFAPYGMLKQMIDADRPTTVLLDDLGQAPPMVQAAAMQLILAREINGVPISEYVRFVAATNRRQDRAGVKGVLEPVKSRFQVIFNLEPAIDDWVAWALPHKIPPAVIAYARFRPETIQEWSPSAEIVNSPCPRTMAAAGKIYAASPPPEILLSLLSGAVGPDTGREMFAFIRSAENIPDPDAILMAPESASVPEKADMKFAVAQALAGRVGESTFSAGIQYMNRMEPEYGAMFVRDAIARDENLQKTRAFMQYTTDNQELFFEDA